MAKSTKPTTVTETPVAVIDTVFVNPETLVVNHEMNSRFERVPESKIDELAWSMMKTGQMQAIEVNPENNTVTAGITRTLAGCKIRKGFTGPDGKLHSKPDFLIRVTMRKSKPAEALRRNITENFRRNELTPMDIAHDIALLFAAGDTQGEIGLLFGFDQPKVSRYRSLNKLTKPVQLLISSGTLNPTSAMELAKPANKFTELEIDAILQKHANAPTMANINDFLRERANAGKKPADATKPATNADNTDGDNGDNDGDNKAKRTVARTMQQSKEYVASKIGPLSGKGKYTTMVARAILSYMTGEMTEIEADAFVEVMEDEIESMLKETPAAPAKKK